MDAFVDVPLEPGVYQVEVVAAGGALTYGYSLELSSESASGSCGNGQRETDFEECDGASAGCDEECEVLFGYACDDESPSTYEAVDSAGVFGAGEEMIELTSNASMLAGESHYRMIEFDEDILVSGRLVGSGENPDPTLYIWNADWQRVWMANAYGNERFTDVALTAGPYQIEVYSGLPLDEWTLTLSTTEP